MNALHTLVAAACLLSAAPFARASDAPPPITVSRIVNAPVAEVWPKWTTSEGVTSFLKSPSIIELRHGGKFEIHFAPDAPEGQRGSEGCTVLSWLPERMLSITWNAPPKYPGVRNGDRRTFIVITLDAMDPVTTRVNLTHAGWPTDEEAGPLAEEWRGTHDYFSRAWPRVLEALAGVFSTPENTPDPTAGWVYLIVGLGRDDLIATMTDEEKRIFGEHYEYLKDLTAKGIVVLAGPCTDGKGPGIVAFHARDEAAARALMEGDPCVKHGLFKTVLHPMRLALVRGRD